MLAESLKSDYRRSLCWIFNSKSEHCAKRVHIWVRPPVPSSDRRLGRLPQKVAFIYRLTRRTTDKDVGKWSHAGLSLLEDIDFSTGGVYAIISRDLVAHKKSLSFTYERPEKS